MPPIRQTLRSRSQKPPVKACTRALEPALLGLDLGTTATKASLLQGTEYLNIVLHPKKSQDPMQFDACDIPSAANLFALDKPPETCIEYLSDDPDQTPLKMFLYIDRVCKLRGAGGQEGLEHVEQLLRGIFYLEHFFKRYDILEGDVQQRVMTHARSIFLAHLRHVKRLSEGLAKSQNVRITKLAATIPSNWDSCMQQHYVELLLKAWNNLNEAHITILPESAAIGHRILRLDHKTRAKRPDRLIVVECGGHTLSHTTFDIQYCQDTNQISPFTVAAGIHGGSEFHVSLVKERIQNDIACGEICVDKEDEPYLYESLMTDYRINYRGKIDGKKFQLSGWRNIEKGGGFVTVAFNDEESLKHYRDSFSRPLEEMDTLFKNAATTSLNTAVVLSGGTFYNNYILEQVEKMIAAAELTLLSWTDSVAVDGRPSASGAVGAALALVKYLSVEQFMS